MKQLKPLWLIPTLALVFLIALISLTTVLDSSVRVLYFSIRHEMPLSLVRVQITTLVEKVVSATALLVSGIYCIYLYMQTYESESFLQLSTMFFLTAGVIMTLINHKVLFYATAFERYTWNVFADLFLLLFAFMLLYIELELRDKKQQQILRIFLAAVHGVLCIVRLMTPSNAFLPWLRGYGIGLCCFLTAITVFRIVQERSFKPLLRLAVLLPLCALFFVVADAKFDSESTLFDLYLNKLPYLLVIYTELLFNAHFQVHRMAVMLGKVGKRRLQEDEQYRQLAMRTFMLYCQQPMNGLNRIAQSLEDTPAKQLDGPAAAMAIRSELRTLSHSVDNALQHIQIKHSPLHPDMGQLSMAVVFGYVKDELELALCGAVRLAKGSAEAEAVQGDPSMLIRANYSILLALNETPSAPDVAVSFHRKGDTLQVQMNVRYDELTRLQQLQLLRRLRKIYCVSQRVPDTELPLTLAKAILAAHDAHLDARLDGHTGLSVSYALPLWKGSAPDAVGSAVDSADTASPNRHAIRVAMLSSSKRQTDFANLCLPAPTFLLNCFSNPEAFERFILKKHVNVVILGSLFIQADTAALCKRLRSRYTMGLLPIILMRPSGSDAIESYYYKYVNDFVFEPCGYEELNQRVLSLAMLQRSTESLRLSRLEFLQAQMDPHFIFNAISTIMPLCIQSPHQAYQLLGCFSDYLRGNLFPKEQNRPIHVYEEIDLIRAYLTLENARSPGMIDYDLKEDFDDECEIFPLLIEPLVENCVKHGLRREERSTRKLHIRVSITQSGRMMNVVVQDDGAGFDAAAPVLLQREPGQKATHRSIGLSNLKMRLRLYYNAELQITSRMGEGTRVAFTIPCKCDFKVQEDVDVFAPLE